LPGTGLVENEAGSPFLDLNPISFGLEREVFALAWLARRGVPPGLLTTIAELACIGVTP
jgi:hypothetical protein